MFFVLGPGFLLDKKIGVNQPKRLENANILIANTGMDTDKIKVKSAGVSDVTWNSNKFKMKDVTQI